MEFKMTVNDKTGKKYYFIDGKRVSFDRYDLARIQARMSDWTPHSIHGSSYRGVTRYYISYSKNR